MEKISGHKIFLLDAGGAFASIIFLSFLYFFNDFFGMPKSVIKMFIGISTAYFVYSTTTYCNTKHLLLSIYILPFTSKFRQFNTIWILLLYSGNFSNTHTFNIWTQKCKKNKDPLIEYSRVKGDTQSGAKGATWAQYKTSVEQPVSILSASAQITYRWASLKKHADREQSALTATGTFPEQWLTLSGIFSNWSKLFFL